MTVRALRVALLAALIVVAAMLAFRTGMFAPSRDRMLAGTGRGRPETPVSKAAPAGTAQVGPISPVAETEPNGGPAAFTAHIEVEDVPAMPGGTIDAAIVLDVADGWHVNANPASDEFLIPTEVGLAEGAPERIERVSYPTSTLKSLSFSEKPLAIYEGRVLIPVRLRVPASVSGDSLTVPLQLTCQACDDTHCLAPETIDLPLRIPLGTAAER